MKKLLILAVGLVLCLGVLGQTTNTTAANRNYLSVSAGPSFPMGDFGSNDMNNEKSGLAKSGYTANLQFTHMWEKIGVVSQVFYNSYSIDDIAIENSTLTLDHWQFYGIMAGPTFGTYLGQSKKFQVNFKAMGGAVSVNSPQFIMDGIPLVEESWNTTFGFGFGADLRYMIGSKFFGQLGADYMSMSPKFSVYTGDVSSTEKYSQPITVGNVHLGLGVRF